MSPAEHTLRRKARVRRSMTGAARRLGIRQLRGEQIQAIEAALEGRDVLVVLPTGFGKSACYQVPVLAAGRPVVLVSPLLALLEDQHAKLLARRFPVVRIDGTVRGRARAAAIARVAEGGPLLVMTTPETLGSADLADALSKSGIAIAAVDEAHCVSEWGHDFRPDYLRLRERFTKLGVPGFMALTATAMRRVREDIVRLLGLEDPVVVASSPHRENLAFDVIPCEGTLRLRALIRLVKRLRRPGIIYASTTKRVDELYVILRRLRIPAHRYHGKMRATERRAEQEAFVRTKHAAMVATSAFGLGIDKPDIGWIIHAEAPASLEQYVQEAGRAGRDGRRAHCVLLFDPNDRAVHEALLARSRLNPSQLMKLARALEAWEMESRSPTMEGLALSAELGPRTTHALLAVIQQADLVRLDEEIELLAEKGTIRSEVEALAKRFHRLRIEDARRLDAVEDYARADLCRAVWLRQYFGEPSGETCGLCNICLGGRTRTDEFWKPITGRPIVRPPSRRAGRGSRRRGSQPRPGRT